MKQRKAKKVREKFLLEVESLDQEGRGVGKRDGKIVFVEGALPSESIEYERFRNKERFEIGTVTQIFKESSLRVEPKCPYFGVKDASCGGCALQHLEPRAQVAMKQKVLMDALSHIGRVQPQRILPPIYGAFWHYRHRARLSVRDVAKKNEVLVGFREKRSSYVADMKSCEILPKRLSNLLVPLRELIGSLILRKKIAQIEVAVAEDVIALVFRNLEPVPPEDLEKFKAFEEQFNVVVWFQPKGPDSIYPLNPEKKDALKLRHQETDTEVTFYPTDFTQVNHSLNECMVSRALRLLKLKPTDKVADFFCGLGNFTLPIGRRSGKVWGIEGSEQLVERARVGAVSNGLDEKVLFTARNLFTWTLSDWEKLWNEAQGLDAVLIDPPREGAMALCESLAQTEQRPKRLVYVSCNPATLARDCNILCNQGGWILKAAGIMNMFPHTAHVESIAWFEPGKRPEVVTAIEETEGVSAAS